MTNFNCMFCGGKMEIPPEVKKQINPVTNVVWHEKCVDDTTIDLTDEQRKFYKMTGKMF